VFRAGVSREGECSVIWIVQIFSHILDEQLVVQDGVVLAERTMKKIYLSDSYFSMDAAQGAE
jgi:hypothetical protein